MTKERNWVSCRYCECRYSACNGFTE